MPGGDGLMWLSRKRRPLLRGDRYAMKGEDPSVCAHVKIEARCVVPNFGLETPCNINAW